MHGRLERWELLITAIKAGDEDGVRRGAKARRLQSTCMGGCTCSLSRSSPIQVATCMTAAVFVLGSGYRTYFLQHGRMHRFAKATSKRRKGEETAAEILALLQHGYPTRPTLRGGYGDSVTRVTCCK